jgi:hypothetical protein
VPTCRKNPFYHVTFYEIMVYESPVREHRPCDLKGNYIFVIIARQCIQECHLAGGEMVRAREGRKDLTERPEAVNADGPRAGEPEAKGS